MRSPLTTHRGADAPNTPHGVSCSYIRSADQRAIRAAAIAYMPPSPGWVIVSSLTTHGSKFHSLFGIERTNAFIGRLDCVATCRKAFPPRI
jgi:hypothetical protein